MLSVRTNHSVSALSLMLPGILLLGLAGTLALRTGVLPQPGVALVATPETIVVEPRAFRYRQAGEFFKAGFAVDAPMLEVTPAKPLTITKYQISAADYDRCVADGACPARESTIPSLPDMPATGVSYDDAEAYAAWLSRHDNAVWSLPSDEQLAFAAGSKFPDDALGVDPDSKNPALRWLADYQREAARKALREPAPQPFGHFGENEYGLADFGGNVWEWTTTCNRRVNLGTSGEVVEEVESCGIYVASGKHRAPLSAFVREPKGGGCSVGTPPDNVGFRLVRDDRWFARLFFAFRQTSL